MILVISPILNCYFISPPLMTELMMKQPVKIFSSHLRVPELIAISIHRLMFHPKVWCFNDSDFFFYPGLFAKIFFLDADRLFRYIKMMFCFLQMFFQYVELNRNLIPIYCGIVPGNYFVFTNIKNKTVIINRVFGFPIVGCLI